MHGAAGRRLGDWPMTIEPFLAHAGYLPTPRPPQPRFRRATRPVSRRHHHRVRSASSIDSSSDASCRCSATHTRDARIFVPLPFGSHSRCSRYASLFENATPGLKRYREPRLDTNISIDYSKDCRRIPSLIDLHECATKTDQPVTTAQKGLHQRQSHASENQLNKGANIPEDVAASA
jgi:hypothetical protein